MARYDGKTAVVTGGSSGIGLATAKLLVQEGARVLATGRNAKAIAVAQSELGDRAIVVPSDTSNLGDIDALVAKAKEALGHVDLLFVNAGIAQFVPFEEVTPALYDEIQSVNTRGAFFTIQRFAPLLRKGSSIVLNTSAVDEIGMPNSSAYAASKAALRSFARTLSAELIPKGIRVNAVMPGPVKTAILGKLGVKGAELDAMEKQFADIPPMKRMGNADEVARAVLFLGFEATFTAGVDFPVDGGISQI